MNGWTPTKNTEKRVKRVVLMEVRTGRMRTHENTEKGS